MKQEIIKKTNQDNQFTAKCKEPNLGGMRLVVWVQSAWTESYCWNCTFGVTSLICDYNSKIFFASVFIITGVLYRCYTNILWI